MKLHLRKNLQILALAFSISIGAHAATQADIASWTRGAKAGDVTDQYNLGLAYGKGEGVAANFTESFKWFKIAAENGHSDSMYFVGGFYLSGTGIERNPLESEKWMLKAAQRGNKDAQQALVLFYRDGAGEPAVPRNAAKAKYWQDITEGRGARTAQLIESRFIGELVTDPNLPPNVARALDYLNSRSKTSRFFLKDVYLFVLMESRVSHKKLFAIPLNATDFKEYTTKTYFLGGETHYHFGFQCMENQSCITTNTLPNANDKGNSLRRDQDADIEYLFTDDDKVDDGIVNAIQLISSDTKKRFGKWVPKYQTDEFGGSRKLLNPVNFQGWSEQSVTSIPNSKGR